MAEKAVNTVMQTVVDGDAQHIHVKVYSPFQTYYDGIADSISAENETGPFDVLPEHHNFITLLIPCQIVIRVNKSENKIQINRAVMHVREGKVTVFLDV